MYQQGRLKADLRCHLKAWPLRTLATMDYKPQLATLVKAPPDGRRVAARDQVRRLSHGLRHHAGRRAAHQPQRPRLHRGAARRSSPRRRRCRSRPRSSTARSWCCSTTAAPAFRRSQHGRCQMRRRADGPGLSRLRSARTRRRAAARAAARGAQGAAAGRSCAQRTGGASATRTTWWATARRSSSRRRSSASKASCRSGATAPTSRDGAPGG